jgi:hypothetical protein
MADAEDRVELDMIDRPAYSTTFSKKILQRTELELVVVQIGKRR